VLKNPREGHEELVGELEILKGETETAEMIIRICLAVSEAGGETSLIDQIEIVSLCSHLELDPAHFGLYRDKLIEELGPNKGA